MKIKAEIIPVPLVRTKINTANKGRFLTPKSLQRREVVEIHKKIKGDKNETGRTP